jgi:chaperonin GroES
VLRDWREKMKVEPVADRILVKRQDSTKVSDGGIHIPLASQEKSTRGKVVSVGKGKQLQDGTRAELCVKAGEEILFESFAGQAVVIKGETLLVMREADIMCIFREDELPEVKLDKKVKAKKERK